MANGLPWLPTHTVMLLMWAGRLSDAGIAEMTGHTRETVCRRRAAAGLPPYCPMRSRRTRRQELMANAAGLYIAHGAEEEE